MSVNLKALLLKKRIEGNARKAYSAAKKTGKSKVDASSYAKKQKHEQVRKDCLGLILEWKDKNPLGSDGCANELPKATSVNPYPSARDGVVEAFKDDVYRNWLITQEFIWEIDIELVYVLANHKNKTHKIDPVFFRMRGCMKDPEGDLSTINQRIEKAVTYSMLVNNMRPDSDKNKGIFEVANYRVSIVGL
jgi:hypothetical protein